MKLPTTFLVVACALVEGCGGNAAPDTPALPPTTPAPTTIAVRSTDAAAPLAVQEKDAGSAPDTVTTTFDVTIPAAAPGAFSGASANVPAKKGDDGGVTGVAAAGDRVIAAGNGFVLFSNDRGRHFKKTAMALRFPVAWAASETEMYVGGEGSLARSADGGETFEPVTMPPMSVIMALWSRTPSDVYAAGGSGGGGGPSRPMLAHSTDHGATWRTVSLPVRTGWVHDIASSGPDDIVLAGEEDGKGRVSDIQRRNAVLLRSTDNGKTWKRLHDFTRGTDFEQSRHVCAASGTLFATSSYALHMTTDLGKTWKLATDVGGEALALACRGKSVIVGGRNRNLWISDDLGATWRKETLAGLFTEKALVSVQAASFGPSGEAYVGFEGLYSGTRHGSLFRREPKQ